MFFLGVNDCPRYSEMPGRGDILSAKFWTDDPFY
jgi:hypothetical protein